MTAKRRRLVPHRVALLLALLFVAPGLAACGVGRALEARALLVEAAAGGPPAGSVLRREVGYRIEGRDGLGDLYRESERPPRAALVLVPGVTPQGRDDPRLVDFARLLARARFAVLVPDLPNLRRLAVSASDSQAIADAVEYLADAESTPGEGVGLVAISYAAGPAVIASLEPRLQDRLAFLFLIGGYHDLGAVIAAFTTGQVRAGEDGAWRPWRREPSIPWRFLAANAERVTEPRERVLLRAIAERRLADPAAPIGDLAARLGAEGAAVLALVDNRDPDRVPALLAGLPDALGGEIAALDLARRDLSGVTVPVLLMHGRNDPVIPWQQSRDLARALPSERVELVLLESFNHVERGQPNAADEQRLHHLAQRLIELREGIIGSGGASP
ncbi:MAG: alpha/beta hydrolase family protein [Kiloniellales bacterium]